MCVISEKHYKITHQNYDQTKMSGRVRLKENGVLDEELPTLLEIVLKYLSKNLTVVYEDDFSDTYKLKEGIIIPNEICDR